MATHLISIRKAGASRVADSASTSFAPGDAVTFTAADNAETLLCFSAEAAAALSPASNPLTLAGGESITFAVGATAVGACLVELQTPGFPAPLSKSAGPMLVVRSAGGRDFPDPPDMGSGT
jgi:hypothetical protein